MSEAEAPEENDLLAVAIHECSHYLVSVHLGVGAWPAVWEVNGQSISYNGHAKFEFNPGTFKGACIGWAGVIGEELFKAQLRYRTPSPFPLTPDTLRDWFETMMAGGIQELSDTDQALIRGHKQHYRAFKTAWRILSKNIARLEKLAGHLVNTTRDKQATEAVEAAKAEEARWVGVLRPDSFPATLEIFLVLVVMGDKDSAMITFAEFLKDDAADFLRMRSDNPFKRNDSDEFKAAVNAQVAEDLARWQRGFNTRDEWCNLAKQYQSWSEQRGRYAVAG